MARLAYTIKVFENGVVFVDQHLTKALANAAGFFPVAATIELDSTNPGGHLLLKKVPGADAKLAITAFPFKPNDSKEFKSLLKKVEATLKDDTEKAKTQNDKTFRAWWRNAMSLVAKVPKPEPTPKSQAEEPGPEPTPEPQPE